MSFSSSLLSLERLRQGDNHIALAGGISEAVRAVQVQTITLSLPDGAHLIRLQLVNNDHSALSPDVSRWLAVKMTHGPAGGAPSIVILSPKTGTTVGADVDVSFAVFNFAMVQPYGQKNTTIPATHWTVQKLTCAY